MSEGKLTVLIKKDDFEEMLADFKVNLHDMGRELAKSIEDWLEEHPLDPVTPPPSDDPTKPVP